MSDEIDEQGGGDEESFAEMFEAYASGMDDDIQVGDRITGPIIAIGKDAVFLDTGTKIDGVVEKDELLDENGDFPHQVGDVLDLYVVSRSGNEIKLSRALSGAVGVHALRDAFERGIPVEGKVKGQCKGGFNVEVMHRRAFCPVSQMDIRYVDEPESHVGATYQFHVIQFEGNGRNIVVSRRAYLDKELEEERKEFLQVLAPGLRLEGRVTKIMPYGAFVEVFPGIEGMVHISELSWSRVKKPQDAVNPGDLIPVQVIGVQEGNRPGQKKISLSIKMTQEDPWARVKETFQEGGKVTGTVTRCAPFGAFVEIAPGIEGLVHISEMSYTKRVLRPEEVVSTGDTVSVMIKEIDPERRRISLSIKEAQGDPWLEVLEKFKPGQVVSGTLEKKEKFGYFVNLEPGITGLLPLSRVRRAPEPAALENLAPGDALAVVIEEIDTAERKIPLNVARESEAADWKSFTPGKRGMGLGSLGEKLREAMDEKNGNEDP